MAARIHAATVKVDDKGAAAMTLPLKRSRVCQFLPALGLGEPRPGLGPPAHAWMVRHRPVPASRIVPPSQEWGGTRPRSGLVLRPAPAPRRPPMRDDPAPGLSASAVARV